MPRTDYERQRDNLAKQRLRQKRRQAVVEALGSKCSCCGEAEGAFLAVDHIAGGGGKHREGFKTKRHSYWLDVMNRISEFRLLCHNCNYAAHFVEGGCPHQKEASNG